VTFSSIGLPGLNGFVGEFLILLGAFQTAPFWAAGAATGVILGAVYMLWMFRRVIFGPLNRPENQQLQDIGAREIVILAPILILIVFMGIYPRPFLSRMRFSAEPIVQRVESKKAAAPLILESGRSGNRQSYGS
jgi:NADH-quinone oxidoreductase subunit M